MIRYLRSQADECRQTCMLRTRRSDPCQLQRFFVPFFSPDSGIAYGHDDRKTKARLRSLMWVNLV